MVTLLIGKKGTGKTKKLIALANEAVAASAGNVVVIEKGAKLTYDVTHKARLIDTEQYLIEGYDMLFGFISGICAGNYDVTDILVDSTFKICPTGVDGVETFTKKLQELQRLLQQTSFFLFQLRSQSFLNLSTLFARRYN